MSLTTGRGPLSARPAGRFSGAVPPGLVYVEPFRRRVRGLVGDRTVVDSEAAVLVHRQGQPPSYAFPARHVDGVPAEPESTAEGYVRVDWSAVDRWYEEDEQVFMHPRNPYHRVECIRTSRRLVVEVAGVRIADTTETIGVYETSLEPRLYLARHNVRMDVLSISSTTTYCPYKGTASYWDATVDGAVTSDVAWSYDHPLPESAILKACLSFDPARVSLRQDIPVAAELVVG